MAALAAVGVSAFQASAADSLAVVTELVQAQCRAIGGYGNTTGMIPWLAQVHDGTTHVFNIGPEELCGIHGSELWVSNLTDAGTHRLVSVASVSAEQPAALPQKVLYVAASDATGAELWVTDGTPEQTMLVKDIWPGVQEGLSNAAAIRLLTPTFDHCCAQAHRAPRRGCSSRAASSFFSAPTMASTAASCGRATAQRSVRRS